MKLVTLKRDENSCPFNDSDYQLCNLLQRETSGATAFCYGDLPDAPEECPLRHGQVMVVVVAGEVCDSSS